MKLDNFKIFRLPVLGTGLILCLAMQLGCGIRAENQKAFSDPITKGEPTVIKPMQAAFGTMKPEVASIFLWPDSFSDFSYINSFAEKFQAEMGKPLEANLGSIVKNVILLADEADALEIESFAVEAEYKDVVELFEQYNLASCDFMPPDQELCDRLLPQIESSRSKKEEFDQKTLAITGQRKQRSVFISKMIDRDPVKKQNYLLDSGSDVYMKISSVETSSTRSQIKVELTFNNFGPNKATYSTQTGDIVATFDPKNDYLDFEIIEKIPKAQVDAFAREYGRKCLNADQIAKGSDWVQTCRRYVVEMERNAYIGKSRFSGNVELLMDREVLRRGSVKFDGNIAP